jgi:hypothetical protein
MKNIHPIDRWLRLALAIGLAQWAYFWLTSAAQWPVYAVAAILGGHGFASVLSGVPLVGRKHCKPFSG